MGNNKIFKNLKGQGIGQLEEDGVFRKSVSKEKHLMRIYNAFGIEESVIKDLSNLLCRAIEIEDRDSGDIYSVPFSLFLKEGFVRDYETEQRFLPLDFWEVRKPSAESQFKRLRVAFDVDDTLIVPRIVTGLGVDTPNYSVIGVYRWFQSQGHYMIIWSGGGKDYAEMWAEKLGLKPDECRDKFDAKSLGDVDIAFDDCDTNLAKIDIKVGRIDNKIKRTDNPRQLSFWEENGKDK